MPDTCVGAALDEPPRDVQSLAKDTEQCSNVTVARGADNQAAPEDGTQDQVVNPQSDWKAEDIGAIRALVKETSVEDVVRLLDHYKARGKTKNPVAYALNGLTKGRLTRDLKQIKDGTIGADGAAAHQDGPSRRLILTKASEIKPKPVRWGWDERIPACHVSLVFRREILTPETGPTRSDRCRGCAEKTSPCSPRLRNTRNQGVSAGQRLRNLLRGGA
jgi:hypothetical protein